MKINYKVLTLDCILQLSTEFVICLIKLLKALQFFMVNIYLLHVYLNVIFLVLCICGC